MDLNKQVVVVTGAGTGIGRAIALRFAAAGATVVATGGASTNSMRPRIRARHYRERSPRGGRYRHAARRRNGIGTSAEAETFRSS
jgi:NAD(P)-dependent dehydrogenase (short-subunit alcohol dehydrogenase family)